ncbi:RNA polymerase sigma-70 factor (ECF subfamily) [Dyadobacter jejuensis]|uniref:RNA polymerase sigma-70 factor (ECF subfamily) n=1 Tax=Dyadobacter jejuensis TaxID=1082580 RepID=A0A316ASF5_9BACT|nr:RNA polymerase sigma-70 factor [Dyadobacter jejuensis]PWJ60458.1 RNA polymerase sigma-70 factor (ECF subfamily) [Dyadobacter jejuensis]
MAPFITQENSKEGSLDGLRYRAKKTPEETKPQEQEVPVNNESFVKGIFNVNPAQGCELLFRLYYSPLCSYAVRFVYSKEVAEDIVSEIFYNLWNSQSYKAINSSYRAYLFRSVRNRSYNYLASAHHQKTPINSLDLEEHPSDESAEDMIQIDELLGKIQQVVNALPPKCKEIFVRSRFEGQKPKEIATELNLSVRTVENHLFKAISILKNALRDYWLCFLLLCLS